MKYQRIYMRKRRKLLMLRKLLPNVSQRKLKQAAGLLCLLYFTGCRFPGQDQYERRNVPNQWHTPPTGTNQPTQLEIEHDK